MDAALILMLATVSVGFAVAAAQLITGPLVLALVLNQAQGRGVSH